MYLFVVFYEGEVAKCSNGAVRLADGEMEFEGRVEICYNNRWGGVCGSSWGLSQATVVCRQLGHIYFGKLVAVYTHTQVYIGDDTTARSSVEIVEGF